MKIAVVGATGLVGQMMRRILVERNFPVTQLIPVATERSIGKTIKFQNQNIEVVGMEQAIAMHPDIALFSAGGETSLQWAPEFEKIGCWVIDNSSAWRMHPECALVVPEINPHHLEGKRKIIANPNCSTIQMVLALHKVHTAFKIKRIVVSTYQSVSGSGAKGIMQLHTERTSNCRTTENPAYAFRIDMNVIPQVDVFLDNGYSKEEMKMHNETQKIYGDDSIKISATTVRVPVSGGHSESANVECELPFSIEQITQLIHDTEGVIIEDDLQQPLYPMPIYAEGKDDVFVGRIRMDYSQPNTFNCWIVADNLRKGAATNAVQIAELLMKKYKLS
ncbi:MAG: aspartate-semialdehyde dehydrogenase [Bacteroidetes bacterium]|nr:aspartate-semialdehyde dehydrogenase [Bacteroidota bacterium]MBP7398607.1 aspartate-semialdehyde dehydrogenase [Chitinophagales bacterium]MBK7108262.1 aspartate-semialdehyde dehydrogenase [Bacteroidota bacterium]MBK8486314.1 aspartate-semialdehyde dehydrogenase [Bacteroidota bacterium]MBK8683096.1 aspartate-semialdehyde dehydrogenase [Bacteroidota bacterium]